MATGIDKPANSQEIEMAESRIAEAAQRLRAQAAHAALAQRHQTAIVVNAPTAAPAHFEAASAASELARQQPLPFVGSAPSQPAAAQNVQDVHIQPVAPRPVHYPEPQPEQRRAEYQMQAGPFIPPAAEQPVRAPRMPTVEELPLPAQNQIRAQRAGSQPADVSVDTKRRTLLERLASFGMSRQEDAVAPPVRRPTPVQPPQQTYRPASAPAPVQETHSEYAKRSLQAPQPRQQAALDLHGRIAPQRQYEDEQLEIPAFLRRQSS